MSPPNPPSPPSTPPPRYALKITEVGVTDSSALASITPEELAGAVWDAVAEDMSEAEKADVSVSVSETNRVTVDSREPVEEVRAALDRQTCADGILTSCSTTIVTRRRELSSPANSLSPAALHRRRVATTTTIFEIVRAWTSTSEDDLDTVSESVKDALVNLDATAISTVRTGLSASALSLRLDGATSVPDSEWITTLVSTALSLSEDALSVTQQAIFPPNKPPRSPPLPPSLPLTPRPPPVPPPDLTAVGSVNEADTISLSSPGSNNIALVLFITVPCLILILFAGAVLIRRYTQKKKSRSWLVTASAVQPSGADPHGPARSRFGGPVQVLPSHPNLRGGMTTPPRPPRIDCLAGAQEPSTPVLMLSPGEAERGGHDMVVADMSPDELRDTTLSAAAAGQPSFVPGTRVLPRSNGVPGGGVRPVLSPPRDRDRRNV